MRRPARALDVAGNQASDATEPEPADEPADPEPLGADGAIRPERFARLVTLASILIDSGRSGTPLTPLSCRSA